MLDPQEHVDLDGEERVSCELFCAWVDLGRRSAAQCPCAAALLRYALDHQGAELRGAVAGDTAWELCCRLLSHPADVHTLGTRELAQLIVYWVEELQVPAEIGATLYNGMVEELQARGKRVATEQDEQAMKSRWVKQLLSRELDLTREALQHGAEEALADLDVDFDMQEPQQESLAMESEQQASALQAQLRGVPAPSGRPGGWGQECHEAAELAAGEERWYECESGGAWGYGEGDAPSFEGPEATACSGCPTGTHDL